MAFFLLAVFTVIFAVPFLCAVTTPFASTLATFGFLLDHVNALWAVAGASAALSWSVCPTFIS